VVKVAKPIEFEFTFEGEEAIIFQEYMEDPQKYETDESIKLMREAIEISRKHPLLK
jgi:hypothetical protein